MGRQVIMIVGGLAMLAAIFVGSLASAHMVSQGPETDGARIVSLYQAERDFLRRQTVVGPQLVSTPRPAFAR
jgi:hypothetical protein